jgi:hypothetical protein
LLAGNALHWPSAETLLSHLQSFQASVVIIITQLHATTQSMGKEGLPRAPPPPSRGPDQCDVIALRSSAQQAQQAKLAQQSLLNIELQASSIFRINTALLQAFMTVRS